jgi:60 kDa SS-A/Ro ribonucleoprotein
MTKNTWTLRDVLRLAHPQGVDPAVGEFILRGKADGDSPEIIKGFARMQASENVGDVLDTLSRFPSLPWETIPTDFLKDVRVWHALFDNGALRGQALVRNVTRLARLGAFNDFKFAADFAGRLVDLGMIESTRLHPIQYLNAAVVYRDGQVDRRGWGGRNKNWDTHGTVLDALNEGFHLAFQAVQPANKRTLVAVDVSGSMSCAALGLDLSCAQVSAAVSMTVARTEPASIIRGFTSSGSGYGWRRAAELTDLGITARSDLADAMDKTRNHNFGSTDCAQPMLWADEQGIEIDTFVIITDSETWAGDVKPIDALNRYRDNSGIDARVAVLGVAGNPFTIADGPNMMDFVGFSSDAPKALTDFSAGRI